MTVTFVEEPWSVYRAECDALWREHYDELAARKSQMKMKPDETAYRALESAGVLHILVARDQGVMVGYLLSVVRPHLHYCDNLCGFEDAYFLTRDHRRGRTGIRLFQAWEQTMRLARCDMLFAMCKVIPDLDHTRMLEWLGFKRTDYAFSKWIGA